MTTIKQLTWTHTKPNTPQRYAAIITDAVNTALLYDELDIRPQFRAEALRTLMKLEVKS